MKALIIDDEPPVITVVKMLVDWDQFQIGTVLTAASLDRKSPVCGTGGAEYRPHPQHGGGTRQPH